MTQVTRRRLSAPPPRVRVTDPTRPREHRPAGPATETGAPTILLVEDDPEIRALFANFLRHAGYHVVAAGSAAEAFAAFSDGHSRVHLLITDVVMPHVDGPTLAERLRARQPDLKVLFVSGYAIDTEPAEAEAAQTTHAPKPLTRSTLLHQVDALLGRPDSRPTPSAPSRSALGLSLMPDHEPTV